MRIILEYSFYTPLCIRFFMLFISHVKSSTCQNII